MIQQFLAVRQPAAASASAPNSGVNGAIGGATSGSTHRGKGQQKVTVEHVHVHAVARRWLGMSRPQGDGSHRKQRINPMLLHMRQAPRCRARTRRGSLCQSPAMKNGRCRMHGGTSPGAPKGNKNAYKHGHYTADAIARRRSIATLIRTGKKLTSGDIHCGS